MGSFFFGRSQPEKVEKKTQIYKVDQVKFKLKIVRDSIQRYLNLKNKDIAQIDAKIAEKISASQQTVNKKQIIPLLRIKNDLLKIIDNVDVRLKLINTKLDEVEMQKINAETIDVLDQSNKYIKEVQDQLEKKDWMRVLDEAKNKVQIQWPNDDEQTENDPAFQDMWKELGGDKITSKSVQRKNVIVEISSQKQHQASVEVA